MAQGRHRAGHHRGEGRSYLERAGGPYHEDPRADGVEKRQTVPEQDLRRRLRPSGHVQVRMQHALRDRHPHAEDVRLPGAAHALRDGQVLPLQRGLHLYVPFRSGVRLLDRDEPERGHLMDKQLRWTRTYLGVPVGRPNVSFFELTSCEGCQLQIMNNEATLLDFLSLVNVVNFREAMTDKADAC